MPSWMMYGIKFIPEIFLKEIRKPPYTILGNQEKVAGILNLVEFMIPQVTAEQSQDLLMVTLYGCTDNMFYHEKAHAMIASWMKEPSPKRNKQQFIQRLNEIDCCLGY